MKKIIIDRYTGYNHNRYDGYSSSRGILAACGGTSTADGFGDDGEINAEIWNGEKPINWEIVLQNLEIKSSELAKIENGEKISTIEYWGDNEIKIEFSGDPDRIVKITGANFAANY